LGLHAGLRNAPGRLRFTTDLKGSIEDALVLFIAVGTPPRPDGSPDLTFVQQVAGEIAEHMNGYKVVVTKSTVPTGTGKMIDQIIRQKNGRHEFSVVSNRVPSRGRPSPTSCGPTASSSAPATPRDRDHARSTGRST
jgi:UDP-glucose 6-dehydrogenase